MRYIYFKNGDAVAQVHRILGGTVDRSGPDAFISDFLRRHVVDSVLVVCQAEHSSRYVDGNVCAMALSIGKIRVLHPLMRIVTALRAGWLIARERPDRIVCGMGGELLWTAALAATLLRIPIVCTRHSGLVEREGVGGLYSVLSRVSLRTCAGVACHGPFLANQVRDIGIGTDRIFEFEADLSEFASEPGDSGAPAEFTRFAGQFQFVVLYAGRIQRNKGVFDVLTAFCTAAAASETEMGLVYAGGGTDLAGLRGAVNDCSAPQRVLLLGHVDHRALPAVMRAATVSVCATRPPLLEGRCMAVLESLVVGLPAVAPDFAAFPYAVRHEGNGLLFRPGSIEDLGRTLGRLASDRVLLDKIRAGAADSGREIKESRCSFATAVEHAFLAGARRSSLGTAVQ